MATRKQIDWEAIPKTLKMFKEALSLGYQIDPEKAIGYRPGGEIWKTHIGTHGYLQLTATLPTRRHFTIKLHKAVAYMVWGDIVFGGYKTHIRHLDSNKLNCGIGNLALGTAKDNVHDKPFEQRSLSAKRRAESIGKKRLSEITKKSAATRGHESHVKYGRMSGALRKKLTNEQVRLVKKNAGLPRGDRVSQREIAAALGVKQGTVCDILAGRCYGDVAES